MNSSIKICLDILRCPNTCRHCERVPGGGHYSLSLVEIRATVERLLREAESAGVGLTEPICVSESCYNPNAASVTLELEVNGDMFPICHEHDPAFLLGNIYQTSLAELIDRYRRDDAVPALHARRVLGLKELARRYGRPDCDEMHHGCSICRTLVYRHLGIPGDADPSAARERRVGGREESLHEEVMHG